MSLTHDQLLTIKANIAANPDLNAHPDDPDGNNAIAALYNLPAVPDYWVWRTNVSRGEILHTTSVDGTTFKFAGGAGGGYITRDQGERDAFGLLFADGAVDARQLNVRQAFTDIFSGANGLANRTHCATIARRKASRVEKLLSTGAGTTAAPGIMGVEGPITRTDIEDARQA